MKSRGRHRLTAACLSALMSISLLTFPTLAASTPLTDLNGDGVIDVFDLVLAKRDAVTALRPITLDISEAEAYAGDTVTFDITLQNNPGLRSMDFVIRYPEALTPVLDENCSLDYTPGTLLGENDVVFLLFPAVHSIFCMTQAGFYADADGILAQIPFTVADDAEPDDYGLSFGSTNFSDTEGNAQTSVLFERGVVTVLPTEPTPPERLNTPGHGIDVSHWQGQIDWHTVRDAGVEFAMLRGGYGKLPSQKDPTFEQNYANAKAAGIPIGMYWYSYAMTPEEAVLEAKTCLAVLDGRQLEYPIAFDIEESKHWELPPQEFSAIVTAFCSTIEEAGYFASVYSSATPLNNLLTEEARARFDVWVANYNVAKPIYSGTYGMWQYSSTGRVNGIQGDVDLNYAYRNYPYLMERYHLNGY